MIFLLLLFLPSQLGFHFWPDWALVNGIRVDYLSPTIYFTDLIILAIWAFNRSRVKVPLISIILITLNILFSLSPLTSIFKWLRILEYYWLFRYLVKNLSISNLKFQITIPIIYTSILTWLQFIKQGSLSGLWYWLGERSFNVFTPNIAKVFFGDLIVRAYATFPHPNILGGWLVVTGLLTGGWPMAIAFTAVIFTFSRTAIFAAIAAILIKKRKLFLLLLLLVPFMIPGSPDSSTGRIELFKNSLNIIRHNPLFGMGLGNFVRLSPQPVHNVFLLAIAELGIPLFLIFCHLIILTFKHSLVLGHWSLVIVIAITATMDHYWWTMPQMQLLFTLLLAFAVKYLHGQFDNIYRWRIQG